MVACGENDLNTQPPVMPDDRRKERDMRRVVEVDPDRFGYLFQWRLANVPVAFGDLSYAAVSADRVTALFKASQT